MGPAQIGLVAPRYFTEMARITWEGLGSIIWVSGGGMGEWTGESAMMVGSRRGWCEQCLHSERAKLVEGTL